MIDRLIDAIIEKQNPTAVGLDTKYDYLPEDFRKALMAGATKADMAERAAKAVFNFNREIIDAVCDIVPAVKVQVAYYEMAGLPGMRCFYDTLAYARHRGLVTIADIKRNDIGATAQAYAAAYLGSMPIEGKAVEAFPADFVTVNGYLGTDGIKPFADACRENDRGAFILVKTSNPSSGELQDLKVEDGRTIYEVMGDQVCQWGGELVGKYGYSDLGAVVGATYPEQGEALRKRLKSVFFLIPGYGAQGAGGKELVGCFDERGLGGVVNASRSILCAYKKQDTTDFALAAKREAERMKADIAQALEQAGKPMITECAK
ncbi:orotidine-5'-phosphate decarboxylase [Luoshenia tenuis]|jgi:orotidine-5'-phosphate decarboxylase|uniref:orotidine-5'-phosphate decarboxylase n=1 Tax=Luoshenia tenuis TaxID=2763654 RepID=UPI003D950723